TEIVESGIERVALAEVVALPGVAGDDHADEQCECAGRQQRAGGLARDQTAHDQYRADRDRTGHVVRRPQGGLPYGRDEYRDQPDDDGSRSWRLGERRCERQDRERERQGRERVAEVEREAERITVGAG